MTPTPKIRLLCNPGLRGIRALGSAKPLPDPLGRADVEFYLRGATALWHGLELLRRGTRRTVLFPAYHCGIELDVLSRAGFRVEFYPVGRDLRIDAGELRRLAGPDTLAVYVIHYFGFPHPLDELQQLCVEKDWVLIEDCAHAMLASRGERPAGTTGDLAIFSLHKLLPVPCGGALVVNRDGLSRSPATGAPALGYVAREVFDLFGRDPARSALANLGPIRQAKALVSAKVRGALDRHGRNGQSADAAGATESFRKEWEDARLPALSRWMLRRVRPGEVRERRRRNYATLLEAAARCRAIAPLIAELPEGACPGFFPVTVSGDPAEFIRFCRARGVHAFALWSGLHPAFPAGRFPDAAWLKRQVIALPAHQDLDEDDLALLRELITAWSRAAR
jgi:perosamine synthetase